MHASGSEWVDPEDPTVIAENELLGAAASIEAAAKKLEQLKPRAKPKVGDCDRQLWGEVKDMLVSVNVVPGKKLSCLYKAFMF